jgi:hypothetical protein
MHRSANDWMEWQVRLDVWTGGMTVRPNDSTSMGMGWLSARVTGRGKQVGCSFTCTTLCAARKGQSRCGHGCRKYSSSKQGGGGKHEFEMVGSWVQLCTIKSSKQGGGLRTPSLRHQIGWRHQEQCCLVLCRTLDLTRRSERRRRTVG